MSDIWPRVLCVVTGHRWAPRAWLAAAPRICPHPVSRSDGTGELLPWCSSSQIPGRRPLPSGSPGRDMAPNLPPFLVAFASPISGWMGMTVPEDHSHPAPGHPKQQRLRESLTLIPGWVQNARFREAPARSLLGSQPPASPLGRQPSCPHWTLDTGPPGVLRRMKRRPSTDSPPNPGWEGRKDTQLL